jgi:hypothetical protein
LQGVFSIFQGGFAELSMICYTHPQKTLISITEECKKPPRRIAAAVLSQKRWRNPTVSPTDKMKAFFV